MAAGPGDHQRVLPQGDRQGKQQKRDHGKHNDADLYGLALSNGALSAITDKLLPALQARRERDLEAVYPIAGWTRFITRSRKTKSTWLQRTKRPFMADLKCIYKARC